MPRRTLIKIYVHFWHPTFTQKSFGKLKELNKCGSSTDLCKKKLNYLTKQAQNRIVLSNRAYLVGNGFPTKTCKSSKMKAYFSYKLRTTLNQNLTGSLLANLLM